MVVTVNPVPAHEAEALDDVTFVVAGTGTTNDGKHLGGVVVMDPVTAAPVGPATPTVANDVANTASSGRVTIGTSATLVLPASTTRTCATLRNLGAGNCDLGPVGVGNGSGMVLNAGDVFDVRTRAAVYAITTSSAVISYWAETT